MWWRSAIAFGIINNPVSSVCNRKMSDEHIAIRMPGQVFCLLYCSILWPKKKKKYCAICTASSIIKPTESNSEQCGIIMIVYISDYGFFLIANVCFATNAICLCVSVIGIKHWKYVYGFCFYFSITCITFFWPTQRTISKRQTVCFWPNWIILFFARSNPHWDPHNHTFDISPMHTLLHLSWGLFISIYRVTIKTVEMTVSIHNRKASI